MRPSLNGSEGVLVSQFETKTRMSYHVHGKVKDSRCLDLEGKINNTDEYDFHVKKKHLVVCSCGEESVTHSQGLRTINNKGKG